MVSVRELKEFYKKKLERELTRTPISETSYSEAYARFKAEQIGKLHSFFERACKAARKTLKVEISERDRQKIAPYIKLVHLDITPEGVYSLAYLSTLAIVGLSVVIGLALLNMLIILFGLTCALGLLYYIPRIPKAIFISWRSRASDQLVLAVLYMVIYMQHTPNLERAVQFVAEHMPPPISLDFMKVLWDVETKKYATIKESLDAYVETWREWDDEFIEAIQLLESALAEPSLSRRADIFDKAVSVILEGTQDHMIAFAHALQSPIQSLHMLGIVLPVMGLVMLPMIGAFMGASIKWYYLLLLYDIALPVVVYAIGKSVLATRPAGTSEVDIYQYKKSKRKASSPQLVGAALFFLISAPALAYFLALTRLSGRALKDAIFSNVAVYFSLELVAAAGFGLAAYYWLSVRNLIKTKRTVERMEREFSSGIFQLGNRLLEHVPAELAFSRVARTMEKSEIAKFFALVDYNIRRLGFGLRQAVFDRKYGALAAFPSAIIKSMMSVLVEGVKKGPEIAGRSLITVSKYLTSVHRVSERLKDLLADTVSSMQMQVKLFVPLITGIVVGLGVLTTTIMLNLGKQMAVLGPTIGTRELAAAPTGAGLLEIFQIEYMIPGFLFQLIVGIYLIEIIILLSILLSGIIYGRDKIEERYMLAQNLFIATAFYVIIAVLVTFIFSMLVSPITTRIV